MTKSFPPDAARTIIPAEEHVRASYFVARHQWTRVRKQWTCLAPDRPHGWVSEDFDNFRARHRWVFARTMPDNPHEYTLRRNALHSEFDDAVRYIRDKGVLEHFAKKPYSMLHWNGYKYWTMGSPLDTTILINRKQIPVPDVSSPEAPALYFPFLPTSVEQLTRDDCLDEDKRPLDTDDFEFFVGLLRNQGTRLGGHWSIELDGYLYWARGTPEKATAIHRARWPSENFLNKDVHPMALECKTSGKKSVNR